MSALLFGSISTLADTSESQRAAFNQAFDAHGLTWHWDRDAYRGMLDSNGGEQRIAAYAGAAEESVDAGAIHRTKSELFQRNLAESEIALRPGVAATVREAKRAGVKVALVTTTSPENVASLLQALDPALATADFDLVVDRSHVEHAKPDKSAYVFALERLGEQPGDCVAVEDNLGGVQAAQAAGLTCIAFPNENTAAHDFATADRRVEHVSFSEVHECIPNA